MYPSSRICQPSYTKSPLAHHHHHNNHVCNKNLIIQLSNNLLLATSCVQVFVAPKTPTGRSLWRSDHASNHAALDAGNTHTSSTTEAGLTATAVTRASVGVANPVRAAVLVAASAMGAHGSDAAHHAWNDWVAGDSGHASASEHARQRGGDLAWHAGEWHGVLATSEGKSARCAGGLAAVADGEVAV